MPEEKSFIDGRGQSDIKEFAVAIVMVLHNCTADQGETENQRQDGREGEQAAHVGILPAVR